MREKRTGVAWVKFGTMAGTFEGLTVDIAAVCLLIPELEYLGAFSLGILVLLSFFIVVGLISGLLIGLTLAALIPTPVTPLSTPTTQG